MQETQHTEFKREWRDESLKKHGMHWDAVTVPRPGLDSLSSEAIGRFKRMAVHSIRRARSTRILPVRFSVAG
ncbi:MAG: hypothetical protein GX665_08115 [Gammaproteobacteria bacterium]|nr:hypothetical protein [Gammaproteobacteria bacterium]